ncbi:hypothetical protein Vretimale_19896, partial [Volvox reticuliferus]
TAHSAVIKVFATCEIVLSPLTVPEFPYTFSTALLSHSSTAVHSSVAAQRNGRKTRRQHRTGLRLPPPPSPPFPRLRRSRSPASVAPVHPPPSPPFPRPSVAPVPPPLRRPRSPTSVAPPFPRLRRPRSPAPVAPLPLPPASAPLQPYQFPAASVASVSLMAVQHGGVIQSDGSATWWRHNVRQAAQHGGHAALLQRHSMGAAQCEVAAQPGGGAAQ